MGRCSASQQQRMVSTADEASEARLRPEPPGQTLASVL